MEKKTVNYLAWGFAIILALILIFYYRGTPASEPIDVGRSIAEIDAELLGVDSSNPDVEDDDIISESWLDVELKNVITGEIFRLSDFDKPILLESFAVWCPTCKKQQDQIQKLIDSGDDSIHVSLDTDPNEDESKVIEHVNRYGYTWPFVIFPVEATRLLIDDFGTNVVNAPRAPVLIVCPDGMARLLKSGVKSADELKEEIDKC